MDTHSFSEEDRLDPVYCRGCRKHVPRAALSADGYCAGCQAQSAAGGDRASRQAPRSERLGRCRQCGSTNLRERKVRIWGGDSGGGEEAWAKGCFWGGLEGLILVWLWQLLGRGRLRFRVVRECADCGHRWEV